MKKLLRNVLSAVLVLFVVAGCGAFKNKEHPGLQKIAAADKVVTAAYAELLVWTENGVIPLGASKTVMVGLDQANNLLDGALDLVNADQPGWAEKITAAIALAVKVKSQIEEYRSDGSNSNPGPNADQGGGGSHAAFGRNSWLYPQLG